MKCRIVTAIKAFWTKSNLNLLIKGGYRAEMRRERKKRDIHRGLMTMIISKL